MSGQKGIDIQQHTVSKDRGHAFDNVFQRHLYPSEVRALKIHFIEAMMKGRADETRFDIAFMKGKDLVMRAEVVMGVSSFDLKAFAVAELKKRYKRSRAGKAMQEADSIVINDVAHGPRSFSDAPEYWLKERGRVDPRYVDAQSAACRWLCEKKLAMVTKDMDAESNEFKAIARKEMLPYHAAYLHWSFQCQAFDGKGRSLDTGVWRLMDFAASYRGGF
jgi:hypothetical protein